MGRKRLANDKVFSLNLRPKCQTQEERGVAQAGQTENDECDTTNHDMNDDYQDNHDNMHSGVITHNAGQHLTTFEVYVKALRMAHTYTFKSGGSTYWFIPREGLTQFERIDTGQTLKYARITLFQCSGVPVYVCSCDLPRRDELIYVNRCFGESDQELRLRLRRRECDHCKAFRTINGVEESMEGEIGPELLTQNVSQFPFLTIVNHNDGPGIVRTMRSTARCLVCGTVKCPHASIIRCNTMEENEKDDDVESVQDEEETEEIFHKKIKLPLKAAIFQSHEIRCTPDADRCVHGNTLKEQTSDKFDGLGVIIIGDHGIESKISLIEYIASCGCDSDKKYEVEGLWWYTKSVVVKLSLLLEYQSLISQGQFSLYGFHKSLERRMINGGYTGEHLVTLSRLQRIWKVYRGCLEYDMEECRECGRFPHVLIMDGTFVGSKKIPKFEQKSGPEKRQIPMNLLRVVPKRDARTHLRRVAERQEVCKPWPDNFEIPAVLKSFIEFAADDSGKLSPEWRPLVLELSAGTASSCILQFHQLTTGEGYRALIEGVNIWTDTHYLKHQDSMLDETPILYKCLFSNKPDVGPFDSRVRKLLSLIYNKSQLIYDEDFLYEHIGPQTPLPPGTPSDHEAFFFWERIHNVPKYEADGDSLAQNLLCSEKRLTKHKQFGHGIMLVTCSHRIIYGFMALPSAESPRHLFEIILKYVPAEHFPEVCVYDNACHAYAYAISREPRLFRNVIMLIDRLHGANHVDCPVAMRLSQYTTHPVLRKINSQACEQNNGRMTGFKGNVPYMNLPTFMETLKLYSYDHNNMILEQK